MKTFSFVVLISGNGSNLQSIIEALEAGHINGHLAAVISNNPQAYGLQRAQQHEIATEVLDHHDYATREDFDQALLSCLQAYQPDYVILAGFMRILGSGFIQAYARRVINIHPSLLPDYKGTRTHQRALDNHETEHGVSIHVVTPELDDGPIIMQGRYTIEPGDSLDSLHKKGFALEHRMYPQLLQWLGDESLKIEPGAIIFRQQALLEPIEFE